MPVIAKLSRDFHEHFGDKLVDELVGLLNLADATYRGELREQNELNFARFDAKLELRIAELRANMDGRFAELRVEVNDRFAKLEAKTDSRFDAIEAKLASFESTVESRLGSFESAVESRLGSFKSTVESRLGSFESRFATKEDLEKGLREQTGLFFAAWGILLASSIALWFR